MKGDAMPVRRDPENVESRHLHAAAELSGARLLEIGCGDGRLTWRYAQKASRIAAFDLNWERLQSALRECPPALRSRIIFFQASSLDIPFAHRQFDWAVLAWSL
jgi:ubiquinone/menaquinone biosynthesis C-methylase UbiE